MNPNDQKPRRKSIRLSEFDYSSPGAYFITICTHNKENIFGSVKNGEIIPSYLGKMVAEMWNQIPDHFKDVELGTFVIMPNHLHGIIIIKDEGNRQNSKLGDIVGLFKSSVSKKWHLRDHNMSSNIWQRNYYEHIIRDQREWDQIHAYIESNPLNSDQDDDSAYPW
jgi:putative transposase